MHTPTRISAASVGEGLIVQLDGQGEKTLVMPSQDISDDVLATLPKLQAVANSAAKKIGRRWKPQRGKNDVDMYELLPGGGKDADVAHALLATANLRCHVNEVLSVLVHRDSDEMEATVQSLGGSRVRGGEMLYQKLLPLESKLNCDADKLSHSALFSIQTVTVRPKFRVKRQSKLRIGFSTCTIRFPNRERAYHLMKTLPKDVHNKVVTESEGAALVGTHDHLAMGWDIRLTNRGEYGSGNHTTRVIAHSYIATVPPSEYGRLHPASFNPSALAKHRKTYSNPDAERVIEVFTNSLQEFQTVICRRRLGFQSFIDHPKEDEVKIPICTICRKKFSFFRRDHFCRLCGHVVCGECSGMYDVEAPVRCVNKYRCCVACIRRVDACHFDDEDIVPALGPVIVDSDDWDLGIVSLSDTLMEDKQEPSKALESLDQLIHTDSFRSTAISDMSSRPRTSSTTTSTVSALRPTKKEIVQDLNQRLAKHLKKAMDTYRADECPVYDSERDYAFEFDTDITTYPGNPLAPVPDVEKVERRLHYMQTSGVLNDDYDRSALDLLSQVAAKQLGCPIGFVGMVDEKFFHAIGNYQLELSGAIPYDENVCIHTIYAERPLIRKNMQRDMRFAQMPTIRDGGVKFYAGFPVRAPDGTVMATLCAVDVEPHVNIGTKEYATMEMLSELAAELIVPRQSLSY